MLNGAAILGPASISAVATRHSAHDELLVEIPVILYFSLVCCSRTNTCGSVENLVS